MIEKEKLNQNHADESTKTTNTETQNSLVEQMKAYCGCKTNGKCNCAVTGGCGGACKPKK